MPYIIRPRSVRIFGAAAFSTIAIAAALPAVAAAACPASSLSQPFALLGDRNHYSLVQGGTFEGGTLGWTLSNAAVVSSLGNPLGGFHALEIHSSGSVVSPGFCVNEEDPTFRFLFHQVGGQGKLNVGLRWTNQSGQTQEASVGSVESGMLWKLSPAMVLANNLPLSASEGTLTPVRLVFSTPLGSEYLIDDVYIDPYAR